MKTKKMKLALIYLVGLVVLLVPTFFVSAQEGFVEFEEGGDIPELEVEIENGNEPEKDLLIEIAGPLSYNKEENVVKIPVNLLNKSNNYLSNLLYGVELFKGDKLNEEGDIFGSTEYNGGGSFSLSEKYSSLAPGEKISFEIVYKHEPEIKSGRYFFKVYASSRMRDLVSMDWSREPIELFGSGEIMGFFRCYMNTEVGDFYPSEGFPLDPELSPSVVIVLGDNNEVSQKISQGDYYVESKIYKNFEGNFDLLRSENKEKAQVETNAKMFFYDGTNESVGSIVKNKLDPIGKSGTYRVETKIVNQNNKQVSFPCYTRWVVEGESARIGELRAEKKDFIQGEKFDLKVEIFGSADDSEINVDVVVDIYDLEKNKIDSLRKNDIVVGGDPILADFTDKIFEKNVELDELEVILFSQSGGELDSFKFKYKDSPEPLKENKNLLTGKNITIFFAILFFVCLFFIVWKYKMKSNQTTQLIFLMAVCSMLLPTFVFAECYPKNMTTHYEQDYLSGCSNGSVTYTVELHTQAGNCMNGVTGTLTFNGRGKSSSVIGLPDLGHIWDDAYRGPYTYSNTRGDHWFRSEYYLSHPGKSGKDGCVNSGSSVKTQNCYQRLVVSKRGNGTGIVSDGISTCGSACSNAAKNYLYGSPVTITAVADSGSQFIGWGGDCAPFGSNSTCTIVMNRNRNVTTRFDLLPPSPTCSISASSNNITAGDPVTLTWNSTNATSCQVTSPISQSLDTSGSVTYNPSSTTTYTINCSGAGGTSPNCSTTLTVNAVPLYSCTGSQPSNTAVCSGDDTGLTADLPWVAVETCTAGRKCEAVCSGACTYFDGGSSSCVDDTGVCAGWSTGTCSGGTRTDVCNDNGSSPVPVTCGGTRIVPCDIDDPEYREVNP